VNLNKEFVLKSTALSPPSPSPITHHPSPFFFPLLVAVSIAASGCRFWLPLLVAASGRRFWSPFDKAKSLCGTILSKKELQVSSRVWKIRLFL
jgi:hypothetical protein